MFLWFRSPHVYFSGQTKFAVLEQKLKYDQSRLNSFLKKSGEKSDVLYFQVEFLGNLTNI